MQFGDDKDKMQTANAKANMGIVSRYGDMIFTARCYASAVYAVAACLFEVDMYWPVVTYLCVSALRIVRLPARANIPAQLTRGRMHSPPLRVTRRRCGRLTDYFGHLLGLPTRRKQIYTTCTC